MTRTSPWIALAGLAFAACTPSLIPGTSVTDSHANRELLKQVEIYRLAVEHRDAQAILDMVSPNYFDTRGHPDDPNYHWNYDKVRAELPGRLAEIKDVRLDIVPRKVDVEKNKAQVSYLFTENFTAQLPAGEVAKHESDLNRMEFERVDKRWLIVRGL